MKKGTSITSGVWIKSTAGASSSSSSSTSRSRSNYLSPHYGEEPHQQNRSSKVIRPKRFRQPKITSMISKPVSEVDVTNLKEFHGGLRQMTKDDVTKKVPAEVEEVVCSSSSDSSTSFEDFDDDMPTPATRDICNDEKSPGLDHVIDNCDLSTILVGNITELVDISGSDSDSVNFLPPTPQPVRKIPPAKSHRTNRVLKNLESDNILVESPQIHEHTPPPPPSMSPIRLFGRSPIQAFGRSPIRSFDRSPIRTPRQSPIRTFGRSPVRTFDRSPKRPPPVWNNENVTNQLNCTADLIRDFDR